MKRALRAFFSLGPLCLFFENASCQLLCFAPQKTVKHLFLCDYTVIQWNLDLTNLYIMKPSV